MKLAIFLFIIGLTYVTIGTVSAKGCLGVNETCEWKNLLKCDCQNTDQYYSKYSCLKIICDTLIKISELSCQKLYDAIKAMDIKTICNWFNPIISLNSAAVVQTGYLPIIINCTCGLIKEILNADSSIGVNDTNLCDLLNCIIDNVFRAFYYIICLVISTERFLEENGINVDKSCLCDLLIALLNQLISLIKCICQYKYCKCIPYIINNGWVQIIIYELQTIDGCPGLYDLVKDLDKLILNCQCD